MELKGIIIFYLLWKRKKLSVKEYSNSIQPNWKQVQAQKPRPNCTTYTCYRTQMDVALVSFLLFGGTFWNKRNSSVSLKNIAWGRYTYHFYHLRKIIKASNSSNENTASSSGHRYLFCLTNNYKLLYVQKWKLGK